MTRLGSLPRASTPTATAAHALYSCACEGARRTARALTQHYEQSLAATGVRATQLPILLALSARGPLPVTPLADALVIDRTTLTRNLTALVRLALISIADGPDRRTRVVSLTDQGREALDQALAQWGRAQAEVERRFGRQRLENLLRELSALTDLIRTS